MVLRRRSLLAIFQFPFLVRPRPVRDVAETGSEGFRQRAPSRVRRILSDQEYNRDPSIAGRMAAFFHLAGVTKLADVP